jgi:hypothetical protein
MSTALQFLTNVSGCRRIAQGHLRGSSRIAEVAAAAVTTTIVAIIATILRTAVLRTAILWSTVLRATIRRFTVRGCHSPESIWIFFKVYLGILGRFALIIIVIPKRENARLSIDCR